MVRIGKIVEFFFFSWKNDLKGYCGDKGLGLAWDCIKVSQVALHITTEVGAAHI